MTSPEPIAAHTEQSVPRREHAGAEVSERADTSTRPAASLSANGVLLRAGSVVGREHLRLGRNNQDGAALLERDGFAVAVVTDGCGSGPSSEVGARLGARFLARRILFEAQRSGLTSELPTRVCESLVSFLFTVARGLDLEGESLGDDVAQQLLFTFQCAVMDGERALVFGVGDGTVAIDGQARVLQPGPDNAPAYLAYRLVPQARLPMDFRAAAATAPVVHHLGPAHSVALATDGVDGEVLLSLAADPAVWKNPFALGRALNVLAPRLFDDSTVALMKRGAP
jgi:Protein phosphatase 2C